MHHALDPFSLLLSTFPHQFIKSKAPCFCCSHERLPSLIRFLRKVARFKSAIGIFEDDPALLVAIDNIGLVVVRQGAQVVITQDGCRLKVRKQRKCRPFQARDNTKRAIDRASTGSKRHFILASLLLKPLVYSANHLEPGFVAPPIGECKHAWPPTPDKSTIFHSQCDLACPWRMPTKNHGKTHQIGVQFPHSWIAIIVGYLMTLRFQPVRELARSKVITDVGRS